MEFLVAAGALLWVAVILVPWRPWSTRERLEAGDEPDETDLSDLTVLIPARNEAPVIERTLIALRCQGRGLRVVLVDDQSSDGTAILARSAWPTRLTIVQGQTLPSDWTGKLWALEQGWSAVDSDLVLLLDADIELEPRTVGALKRKLIAEELALVSIMAQLRMDSLWEKLLVPAFVYFFKLLYPFALGNNPQSRLGVAAGGCILIRSNSLKMIGAFHSLRNAIIDDCSLADSVKKSGGKTWIGLSHSVRSHRAYVRLASFWEMVERTAFTQLRYSIWLLFATTFLMVLAFWLPLAGVLSPRVTVRSIALGGIFAMTLSYAPTLRYYRRSVLWAALLPVVGSLYLLMTWSSALRYWRGKRSEWKGRVYARVP
ncbi:MAG: glycosyltransferase [Verrucomicrobia bacterium]|nr:glycosyltransferase [Verrucomicrobiota bacterium]MBV8641801.1 glycosyltransferase [Verrucomicrobiota bacterium]